MGPERSQKHPVQSGRVCFVISETMRDQERIAGRTVLACFEESVELKPGREFALGVESHWEEIETFHCLHTIPRIDVRRVTRYPGGRSRATARATRPPPLVPVESHGWR